MGDNLRDWGTTRQSYYDADIVDTEADALEEEAEAERLQQKRLEGMREIDFGFDEDEWAYKQKEGPDVNAAKGTVYEKLPDAIITDEMNDAEKLKVMRTRYPEFEFLAKDFLDLEPQLENLQLAARAAEVALENLNMSTKDNLDMLKDGKMLRIPFAITKFRALSSYLGSIAMYLALLTSTPGLFRTVGSSAPVSPVDLRSHPIIPSLVHFRQLWTKVRDIPLPPTELISDKKSIDEAEPAREAQVSREESNTNTAEEDLLRPKRKKRKISKFQRAALDAMATEEAQQAARLAKTEADLAELSSLVKRSAKLERPSSFSQVQGGHQDHDSDFGDEAPLTTVEAAEKAMRKKSLRFYTSQIAQKANRRGAKGRDASGDMDLPYKERVIDKRERLNREAQRRGRQENRAVELGGADDDAGPADEEGAGLAKKIREEADAAASAEGYYQQVDSVARAKKAARTAAKQGDNGAKTIYEETVGPDGKRAIGYAIQKNKGLVPKRSKDVRNPRVKKKKKYDEKRKKLGSVRQVYRGGEGRGGYGGELTGINQAMVRSRKL